MRQKTTIPPRMQPTMATATLTVMVERKTSRNVRLLTAATIGGCGIVGGLVG